MATTLQSHTLVAGRTELIAAYQVEWSSWQDGG